MKFLDIIENGWASESNPHRTGIFIRDKGKTIQLTDGKGEFWDAVKDKESKLTIIGSPLSELNDLAFAINEWKISDKIWKETVNQQAKDIEYKDMTIRSLNEQLARTQELLREAQAENSTHRR